MIGSAWLATFNLLGMDKWENEVLCVEDEATYTAFTHLLSHTHSAAIFTVVEMFRIQCYFMFMAQKNQMFIPYNGGVGR